MKKSIPIAALLVLCLCGRLQAQPFLQGKIINAATREPVAGASVVIGITSQGTVTNEDGLFKLALAVPDTLVITHISFITKHIAVNPLYTKELVIELEEAGGRQDEVVVIGYGTTTKRFNTGSVSKISGDIIAQQPVANVLSAIQGRAPGVFVSTENGLPGGNITVQVRGKNSIAAGNNPLYVIDGVPFNSTPLNQGRGDLTYANGVTSPLNTINPADIESIEILKDADATAIYGSRGANGVILITTKKGAATGTQANVNIYSGTSRVGHYSDLLNLQQYLLLRREAFANDGTEPDQYSAPDLIKWDTTEGTDWQRYILGGTAHITDLQAGISGGSRTTHFLIGGNYRRETSILPGEQYYKRGGLHFNINHQSADKRLQLSLNGSYTKDKNVLPPPIYSYAMLPPGFMAYNADGKLNWDLFTLNPAAALMQQTESAAETMVSSFQFSYNIWKGLRVKLNAGYTKTTLEQFAKKPAASLNPRFGRPNSAVFGNNGISSYIAEPQLQYQAAKGKHSLDVLAGGAWQRNTSQGLTIKAIRYNNEALMESISAAGDIEYVQDNYTDYRYTSVFGRVNYRYANKYIINASYRRDGSSRFGPGRQFGNFGAAGAAWLFTEEAFIKKALPFIQYGKLRASYGITGNDQVADYQYRSAYQPGAGYGGVTTFYPVRLANPAYGWETTRKLELAVELGILNNRLNMVVNWYHNRSNNQLVQYPLPSQTGFTGYQYNLPALVQNNGWELEVHSANIKHKNFSWSTGANLAIPKNRLLSFPGLAESSFANTYVVGQSLSVVKGYNFLGVDPQTGIPQYEDVNKDGAVSFPGDYVVIGNQVPLWYGGLNNTLTYKGFSLAIFFQFVQQSGLMPAALPGFDYTANSFIAALDRWQQPGDITGIPIATTTYGLEPWLPVSQLPNSSAVFAKAGYIRLKTASLSYNLPAPLMLKIKLAAARVYVECQNLFTIASGNRIDPELLTSAGGIPPLRTIAAGIQLNF